MIFQHRPIVFPDNPVFVIESVYPGFTLSEAIAARAERHVYVIPLNTLVSDHRRVLVFGVRRRKGLTFWGRVDTPVSDVELQAALDELEEERVRRKFGKPTKTKTLGTSVANPPDLYIVGRESRIRGVFNTEEAAIMAGLSMPREPIWKVRANGWAEDGDRKNFELIKQHGVYADGHGQSDPEYAIFESMTAQPTAPATRKWRTKR